MALETWLLSLAEDVPPARKTYLSEASRTDVSPLGTWELEDVRQFFLSR